MWYTHPWSMRSSCRALLQHPPFPRHRMPLRAAAHPFTRGSGLVRIMRLCDPDLGNARKSTSLCFVSKIGARPRYRCWHVAGLLSPSALMPKPHCLVRPGFAWQSADFFKDTYTKVEMPGKLLVADARWESLARARLVWCWSAFRWGGVHVGGC